MNLDRASAIELASNLRDHFGSRDDVDAAVAPPYVYLEAVREVLDGSPIKVGAQDCSDQDAGAFTGEVSSAMLADLGLDFVILGHSERRHVYGETDATVNAKVHRALGAGLRIRPRN